MAVLNHYCFYSHFQCDFYVVWRELMCSASCNASIQFDCQRRHCGKETSQDKGGNFIIWIATVNTKTVHLFLQRPGQLIEPLSVGCCCNEEASSLENLAKYLDTALVDGHYTGLVLVGSEPSLRIFKGLISPAVHNRVIAEIVCDVAGSNVNELTRSISERIML
ncbi:MAG: host attachment family protein [Rickettsiales bacterium]|nr:host attachment family protein [Rickettsiales bacterium]